MYKRRRLAQPQLPSSPSDADAIVRNSRYAELDGGTFYRRLVNADAHADYAFPALYALVSRKTQSLYAAVFEKVNQLVPSFTPLYAMADFEEAPVAAFKSFYVDANVAGCWFHYAQALTKRVQKIGLRDAYHTDAEVGDTVRCLLGLLLLPPADISAAFDDVEMIVTANVSATTSSPPSVDADRKSVV